MGIENLHYLIDKEGFMQEQPEKDERDSPPIPATGPGETPPLERQGQDAAELSNDEAAETVPKPVDDPNLPVDGDPEEFDEEPVDDDDFDDDDEAEEELEDPNDLSEVDKEFDD